MFGIERLRRWLILGIPALLIVVLAAACGGGASEAIPQKAAGTPPPAPPKQYIIKVATLRQPHLFHPAFYERFLPPNIKMEVVPLASSPDIKNALITGSAEFGVVGLTASLAGAAQDEPIRVIASAADGGSAIVARNDRNITTVQDLKGKKIGYPAGASQDILLRLTLKQAGIDPEKDVTLIKLGFTDMALALERGDIDAFCSAETGPSDSLVRGNSRLVVYPYNTPMKRINIVFATSQTLIDKDPQLVQAMVEVHAKATAYMRTHQDEWAAGVVKAYGSPPEALALAVNNISLRWEMDEAYFEQARVQGAEMEGLKYIKKQPDYKALFNSTFVTKLMNK
jgi:NitT/TauT family transport system substrate-binding protein